MRWTPAMLFTELGELGVWQQGHRGGQHLHACHFLRGRHLRHGLLRLRLVLPPWFQVSDSPFFIFVLFFSALSMITYWTSICVCLHSSFRSSHSLILFPHHHLYLSPFPPSIFLVWVCNPFIHSILKSFPSFLCLPCKCIYLINCPLYSFFLHFVQVPSLYSCCLLKCT